MSGDGATPAAILTMPALMSLAYIRAEASAVGEDAYDEAVAATVRNFIEQATYALEEPLSQRDDKDADTGAAARCLLGLYPGSMLLSERRKCAAGHLVKSVRTLTKRRERNGRVISHEMLLMEQLASQLWDREADFLRGSDHSQRADNEKHRDSPWLAMVHDAWSTARELTTHLEYCCDILRPKGPRYEYFERCDYNSLELFGKLWKYVIIPKQGDPWLAAMGTPEEEIARIFPSGRTVGLYYMSPFKRAILERLAHDITEAPTIAPIPVIREFIEPWRAWLKTCKCDVVHPDPNACGVHRFRWTLKVFTDDLDECWQDLRDPYRTPSRYRPDPTPSDILESYGLRAPDIDNSGDFSI